MGNFHIKSVLLLLVTIINISCITSEKILVVTVFSSKSMKNFYEPLVEELANRGHELTVISPFKASNKNKRIRDIQGPDVFTVDDNMKQMSSTAFQMRQQGGAMNPLQMIETGFKLCTAFYETPAVQGLLNEKFDLILASYSFNECGFGLIHHFGAPFILMHANVPLPWNNPTGMPYPLSFLPLPFFGYTDKMTFYERTLNFGLAQAINLMDQFYRLPRTTAIYRKYLGQDTPSAEDIAKNVSLIISNSHFSLNFPRPTMPDMIEVGGMHCKPAKELPADLKKFVESSGDNGFIFFSMGSVLKGSMMPEESRKAFIKVFSELKQNVLWKWETETMEGLPKNVKLSKWLPQQDILGHKNIRAFITHGGLHSTEEAAYHGVPLIGIPMFGDQDSNMKVSEHLGFAVTLQFANLTEGQIRKAINQVLTEPIYRDNAKKLSGNFKDRLDNPLDKAVFHVEYVIRHKGAHHLRSPSRHLNFIQYHSLDVLALVIVILVVVLSIIYFLLRLLLKGLCSLVSSKKAVKGTTKSKSPQKSPSSKKKYN